MVKNPQPHELGEYELMDVNNWGVKSTTKNQPPWRRLWYQNQQDSIKFYAKAFPKLQIDPTFCPLSTEEDPRVSFMYIIYIIEPIWTILLP